MAQVMRGEVEAPGAKRERRSETEAWRHGEEQSGKAELRLRRDDGWDAGQGVGDAGQAGVGLLLKLDGRGCCLDSMDSGPAALGSALHSASARSGTQRERARESESERERESGRERERDRA